ncbi:DUF89 family protein [bacterium]|nr:DUF89 family protein [bacterium]
MRTYFECIPCFIKQTVAVARFVTDDVSVQEEIIRRMLKTASEINLKDSPPKMGQILHRTVREVAGNSDPYKDIKERFNRFALAMLPDMQKKVEQADDPLEMAVRLAIAGNIIDFGAKMSVEDDHIHQAIEESIHDPIDLTAITELKEEAQRARNILFLGDNCGEIVFDQLLLHQLPKNKITYVVKGSPCINDATMEDAIATALTQLVPVIDNGLDAPGTIVEESSPEFQQRFQQADVVIAKGQGNYETLSEIPKNIFFILKAKCSVIADHLGCKPNSLVIKRSQAAAISA